MRENRKKVLREKGVVFIIISPFLVSSLCARCAGADDGQGLDLHLYTKAPMVRARIYTGCKFNPLCGPMGQSARLFIKNTILEPRGLRERQTNGAVHFAPRKRDHDAPNGVTSCASGFYLSAADGRVKWLNANTMHAQRVLNFTHKPVSMKLVQ